MTNGWKPPAIQIAVIVCETQEQVAKATNSLVSKGMSVSVEKVTDFTYDAQSFGGSGTTETISNKYIVVGRM